MASELATSEVMMNNGMTGDGEQDNKERCDDER